MGKLLGLFWDAEELQKPEVRPDAGAKQLQVPLALVIQPELPKILRDYIQKAKDEKGQPIKELGALPRDDFMEFYRKYVGGVVGKA